MTTGRFGFTLPDGDDYYDINEYNANMKKLELNAVNGIGALTMRALTAEEYEALEEKNTETFYIVIGKSSFTLYLGEVPLQSGGGNVPVNASIAVSAVTGTIGNATVEEVTE